MLQTLVLAAALTMALGAPTGDLQVTLSPVSSSVQSIKDIIISATVSNPTNKDIRVLAVNNILDSSRTRSFTVSKNGEGVTFTGIKAIFDMTAESVYKVIPAGSSVTVNHTNIAPLYDFQSGGVGKFKFSARPLYLAGANKAVATNTADVVVDVTDDVVRRKLGNANKSTAACDDRSQLEFVANTVTEAIDLARAAADDIINDPTSNHFTKYFSTNDPSTVQDRFQKIADDQADRTVSCEDQYNECSDGATIAYTALQMDDQGNIISSDIYSCPIFFTDVSRTPSVCQTGFDDTTSSDGGVMLHELSHANSGTRDIAYGCSNTESLSAEDQLNNADNFRCLSLAVYSNQNCNVD